MPFLFNPLTASLDLVNESSGATTNNTFFNSVQVDQTGGTADTHGVLAGSVNGANTSFTVSNGSYLTGTLSVYLNGQQLTQGSSEDWVEDTPASGTFSFNAPPETGDQITATYVTQDTGGVFKSVTTETSNATLTTNNDTVIIDASSSAVQVTLPDATTSEGKEITIIGYDTTNAATIATTSSQQIRRVSSDTNTTDTLVEGDIVKVISTGTYWQVSS